MPVLFVRESRTSHISSLLCGEASELKIRHFFSSLKSLSFFSCCGDSERERASKKAPHGKRVRQRAHISGVLSEGFIKEREREREREVQRDISRGENWSDRMFFHVRREKNVVLEPRHFGARMKDVIMEKIKLEVRLFIY